MVIHMQNQNGVPLCWGFTVKSIAIMQSKDISKVTCVECLRILPRR